MKHAQKQHKKIARAHTCVDLSPILETVGETSLIYRQKQRSKYLYSNRQFEEISIGNH